ncbi:MAG: dihydrofolate reductase family protein [Polyangiales bacterium]
MRKLTLSIITSVDGLTARVNRDLEWFLTDAELEAELLQVLRSVDGMLFGRIAYQELAQFWPNAGTDDPGDAPGGFASDANRLEFARLMNSVPKLVVSRTLTKLEWGPGRIISGDLGEAITQLKREPGRDLVVFAGAQLAAEGIARDVFDEYRLYVHPRVLGQGLPLFQGIQAERSLELIAAKTFPCGVVLLHYKRAK